MALGAVAVQGVWPHDIHLVGLETLITNHIPLSPPPSLSPIVTMSSKHISTITDLKVAVDEGHNKRYRKGKFLGKVVPLTHTHTHTHTVPCPVPAHSCLVPWAGPSLPWEKR